MSSSEKTAVIRNAFKACAEGNLRELKACVGFYPSIITEYIDHTYLIHAGADHLAIVEYLVSKGADLNSMSKKYNWSLLNFALEKRNFPVVKFFVDKNRYMYSSFFETKSTRIEKFTPLQYAVLYNFLPAVKLLIDAGVDPLRQFIKGQTNVLHIAAKQPATVENSELVQYLLSATSVSPDTYYVHGYDLIDEYGFAPLHYAILSDDITRVKLFVEAGANIEFVGETYRGALHIALERRRKGTYAIASYLIEKGANIEESSVTSKDLMYYPLHLAVLSKDIELVKLLVSKGARLDCETWYGNTPRDIAVKLKLTEIGKLLTLKLEYENLLPANSDHTLSLSEITLFDEDVYPVDNEQNKAELAKGNYFYNTKDVVRDKDPITNMHRTIIKRAYHVDLLGKQHFNPVDRDRSWKEYDGLERLRKLPLLSEEGGGSGRTGVKGAYKSKEPCMRKLTVAQEKKLIKWISKVQVALMNENKSVLFEMAFGKS